MSRPTLLSRNAAFASHKEFITGIISSSLKTLLAGQQDARQHNLLGSLRRVRTLLPGQHHHPRLCMSMVVECVPSLSSSPCGSFGRGTRRPQYAITVHMTVVMPRIPSAAIMHQGNTCDGELQAALSMPSRSLQCTPEKKLMRDKAPWFANVKPHIKHTSTSKDFSTKVSWVTPLQPFHVHWMMPCTLFLRKMLVWSKGTRAKAHKMSRSRTPGSINTFTSTSRSPSNTRPSSLLISPKSSFCHCLCWFFS
mmetsp:Transcript_35912/g.82453  ORF Transcript_35912/g.82453 Transcript_35912/m.82453 type:complete len:251 (-) Transcript_35912:480-1232(-)